MCLTLYYLLALSNTETSIYISVYSLPSMTDTYKQNAYYTPALKIYLKP